MAQLTPPHMIRVKEVGTGTNLGYLVLYLQYIPLRSPFMVLILDGNSENDAHV